MYNYEFIISVFSNDNEILKLLEKIKFNNNITYKIDSYDKLNKKAIENSRIVIVDENIVNIDDVKANMMEDTRVLLLCDKFNKSYDFIHDVLLKPIDYDLLLLKINQLIKHIELEEDLLFSKSLLQTTIDGCPDMFWIKTLDGIHTHLNKEFCDVINKERCDVLNKDHYCIWDVSPDDPNSGADLCKETEDKVIKAKSTLSFAETVKSKNGIRQLITYKTPIYDRFNNVVGTCGYGHDITDLENRSVEMQILLNSVPFALLIRDDEGKIKNINDNFQTYFNVKRSDVIDTYYDEWINQTFYPDREINESGYIEAYNRTKSNNEKITELRLDNIKDVFGNVTGQICIFRDVTLERKVMRENLLNSNVDFVTKLYNRRYLDNFISESQEGEKVTLFAIDLDHFKNINDTFGHKTGDEAIILAGNTLKEYFPNDLVVRLGGDEFLVVKLGNIDVWGVEELASGLLEKFKEKFESSQKFKILSASIGVCQGVIGKDNFEKLMGESDKALYEAKNTGRSRYVIYK